MAGLLDFSTGTEPQTGDPGVQDPSTGITYPNPQVQGAVTGIVNGVAQSVQGFFDVLPQNLGLAVPTTAYPGVLPGGAAGGIGIGTILLIGAAVFLLARKR
jgi:hypothetical protein